MADIFVDGFDKYGPVGLSTAAGNGVTTPYPPLQALLMQDWTGITYGNYGMFQTVAPLSSKGQALSISWNGGGVPGTVTLVKSIGANYARLIGGVRFNPPNVANASAYIYFADGASVQCSIILNAVGKLEVRSGANGALLGTHTGSAVASGSTHYLEWDITFGTAGAYQLKLDGVTVLTGTGNTLAGSTNNYANAFGLGAIVASVAGSSVIYDDCYLFDSTGTTNNAMLGTNPVVETEFAISDNQTQFSNGATILGAAYCATANTNASGANQLFLRKATPQTGCTLNSVSMMPQSTSGTAKFKAVIYADSAGSPGALLSSGTEFVGVTSGTLATGALVTPQALNAGTAYWIGFITDTQVSMGLQQDAPLTGVRIANTYTSGAPATAGAVTGGQSSWMVFGNCTGSATNWPAVSQNPPGGDLDFAASSTVSAEELYNFAALSRPAVAIYTVAVKALVRNTASGARTIDVRTKSGATDSAGSNPGQSPGQTYQWLGSFFDTDPATSAAWATAGLNAAPSGIKVAS